MQRRLHIAYVCGDRGVPIGGTKGASVHVRELTHALSQQGAEVHLLGTRVRQGLDGVASSDLGGERGSRLIRQQLFEGARGERQEAGAAEAHALMLNGSLARELDRLHRRWRIDAVYERYSLWTHAAATFARAAGVPYLLEVNAPLRREQRRYRRLENAALAETLEGYAFKSASHVLVPSAEIGAYVLRRGVAPGNLQVLPNAADPSRFTVRRARLKAAGEPFVIGFLGTLKPWHGLSHLLSAFRLLRKRSGAYRLLIAGDGPLRQQLEASARRGGFAADVTFTGEVAFEEVPGVLAQMDVGVAPYPRMAGFYFSPLKIFEYMAAGLPLVASDIGQISEVISDGRTGLLVTPGDVAGLAAAIERLHRRPDLARAIGRAGRTQVQQRYTWKRTATRVLRLIRKAKQ